MTSFTRALYRRDPAAAEAFQRQQRMERELLLSYGKTPTLACFTPAHHDIKRQFGKRAVPPQHVPCPHQQTFCIRNGLSAHTCPVCSKSEGASPSEG
jgi:hypothetical protein